MDIGPKVDLFVILDPGLRTCWTAYTLGIHVPSQKVIGGTVMYVLRVQVPFDKVLASLGI